MTLLIFLSGYLAGLSLGVVIAVCFLRGARAEEHEWDDALTERLLNNAGRGEGYP